MDIEGVENAIRNSDEFRMRLVQDVGTFTVALFAIHEDARGERLELAGTGTLVLAEDSHYLLTAAHVWEERLRSAVRIGITLPENIDHRFVLEVGAVIPSGPPKPQAWGHWGPDMVRLRIPAEYVGGISAYRSFYSQAIDGRTNVAAEADESVQLWLLMGTPAELGNLNEAHADVEIAGMFLEPPVAQQRGEFDYLDFDVDLTREHMPQQFGGVSGGGLWQLLVYSPRGSEHIRWLHRLEGVAFYQFPIQDGQRRTIRCHGPETLRITLAAPQPYDRA